MTLPRPRGGFELFAAATGLWSQGQAVGAGGRRQLLWRTMAPDANCAAVALSCPLFSDGFVVRIEI